MMKTIDAKNRDDFSKRDWTRLVNGLSGAKSPNLIGSISESGQTNLSIISSVFHLGANPPLMGFILRPHSNTSPRHTFLNISESGQYTINHVQASFFKQAHQTSARYDRDVSEFKECGLTEDFKDGCKAPFVKESTVQVGLRLLEILPITHNKTHLVIGEVEKIHIAPEYLRQDGSIDVAAAGSLAVTGLDEYHNLSQITRMAYAKPDLPPIELADEGETH